MSTRILNPIADSRRTAWSKTGRGSMKNPLIGSVTGTRKTGRASNVAKLLMPTRVAAKSPMPPPSTWRDPTTMSTPPARNSASIFGSTVSSCCRSPSMAAMWLARLACAPSMNAEARPRRPMRCNRRTRGSAEAAAWIAARVPSVESSSTKITSQAMPASALPSRATMGAMLSRSLITGMTTHSSGIVTCPGAGQSGGFGIIAAVAGGTACCRSVRRLQQRRSSR